MPKSVTKINDQAWLGVVLKGLIILLSWMPLRLNQFFGKGLGYLFYWLPNDNRRVAKLNLQQVYPQLKSVEFNRLLKHNMIQTAKAVFELGPVWCWRKEKLLNLIVEVKGQDILDKAYKEGKGVLFLAPHIGCWELLGTYLSALHPSTFLYRPPNIPSVEKFMVNARARFGAKLAPTDARGVRLLMKALKNNEVSVILPDQDPGEAGGIHAPFFGYPARTMTLVSKLVQKTDCVCVFAVVKRLPKAQGYELHILPAGESVSDVDPVVATKALNEGVEACISVAPEQYLWSYKRYRRPPKEWRDLYKK